MSLPTAAGKMTPVSDGAATLGLSRPASQPASQSLPVSGPLALCCRLSSLAQFLSFGVALNRGFEKLLAHVQLFGWVTKTMKIRRT